MYDFGGLSAASWMAVLICSLRLVKILEAAA